MVFESIVAELLNRFLGDYVQNFDSSKLKLGIFGGDVTLKHLDVKESALDDLDLPVKVVSGHLGQLILKIPWRNMYTAPVIATIEGLYVVVVPNLSVKYDAEKEEKAAEAAKQAELQRIEEAKTKQAEKDDTKDEKKQDTFTEKLVTQIVKNLQVRITDIHIRYEDNFSNPKHPFGVGFTLHNLSFETTDDKWNPCIIQENVSLIHKLITLDSLAVYWNSGTTLFSNLSVEDRQNAMEKSIATKTFKPHESAYLLGPINSRAQLQLNQKPESDGSNFKIPKVWINVVMDEIAVGLSRRQYQDLMKLLESLDRMTVASLYRKYRPNNVPHLGHEREWWKFAISAVLEEDVRRKRQNWSWVHMKKHRGQCKLYKELYVSKLSGKKFTPDMQNQICECEMKLDLFNITVVRKQAELEFLRSSKKESKKTWGSWIGGWFSKGEVQEAQEESTGKKIVKQFEEAMTPEEKAKLYEAIGYQEQQIVVTEYPNEFVANKLLFTLHNLIMSLSDDTKTETQVLKTNLKEVTACVEQRPAAQAMSVDAKIDSFIVNGVPSPQKNIPTLVSSQRLESSNLPLLSLFFETNPLDGTCDHRVHVKTQPLEIVYDAVTVNNLAEVFKPPEEVSLQQLQSAAVMKLEDFREMSAFGLQYAIEQHKYLDLKVDMQPTFITVPENGVFQENIHLLVVSLGRFKMDSTPRDVKTVKSMVRAGSTEAEVMTSMIESAYDKFHIEVQNAEIILAAPADDWKSAIGCHNDSLHLLRPVSIKIDLHKSIVSVDPRMPKVKVAGELVLLNICISDTQLLNLLKLATSIPLPEGDATPPPTELKRESVAAPATGYAQVNAKALQVARKEAVTTFKEAGSGSDSDDEDQVRSHSVQYTEFEMKFEIKEFGFILRHKVVNSDSELMKFGFQRLGISLTMRTFDMSSDIYLGGIMLEYPEYKAENGKSLRLLSTPVNETEEHLFLLNYLAADKKGPHFESEYNSTLQLVTVTFRSIDVVLHQEAILSLMEFANNLVANMESVSQQSGSAKSLKAVESVSVTSQKTVAKDTKKQDAQQKLVTTKKKYPPNLIDMEIRAGMDSIGVIICNCDYEVTNMRVKGLNAAVIIQKAKTCVNASVKDLIVCDPGANAVYPKILSTLGAQVLDLNVSMYNDATDDDNYADMSVVDMSIAVSFGRVKIVFLNKFVASLLFFLDHFQAAKDKVAEASAVAAEAAKHSMEEVYDKASRILLNVCIEAPVIIVPQNSSSKNAIVADLGTLKISNKFELGDKRNELGAPAIFDRMLLDLQSLQLSRALVNPQPAEIMAECLLLEPISFCLSVDRNLSSGWHKEKPEVDICGKLEAVKVALSQDDYSTVMSVLSENLSEVPDATVETVEPPVTATTASMQMSRPSEDKHLEETKKKESKVEICDIIKCKPTARFKFRFLMDSFCATFYSGETALVDAANKRDSSKSIARVELTVISIEAVIMHDNSKTAQVVLVNSILDDTRASRKRGITRLMERTSNKSTDNMIRIKFTQDVLGESNLSVKVSSFTLVVCLSYLMQLGEFFTSSPTKEETPPVPQTGALAVPRQSKPAIPQSTTAEELSSDSKTIIELKLEQPDIVLIEDIENLDSDAIFLNNEFTAKVIITQNVKVVSGKVANLTFYTACFNPETRNSTLAKILSPCDIDIQCNIQENSQHMDILFKDLILHISPGTVHLITNILSSLVTESAPDVENVEKVVDDFSGLWLSKKLEDCNFWFLQTVKSQNAVEAAEDLVIPSVEETVTPVTREQLLFTMRKVVITIEAGVGNRTVPMILLESSFQADIRDWSTNLYIGSSLGLEVSYYNERIAVWEPLVEPVETSVGHRSWELMMEISKEVADNPDMSPDEEEPPEDVLFQPPLLSIAIVSLDVMQLTVSKCCLEVLSNLGQAFGDAVKQTAVKEVKYPHAPYQIQNYLGIPVTINLDNCFQIMNEKDRGYANVTIESRAPPLSLIYFDPEITTQTRLSVLKKQDLKEDVSLSVKISAEDMDIVRKISVACTDKRFFQLPKRTYPGDKWGFIVDVQSMYGCKIISFQSILQVHNHFSIPFDVYYMTASLNELNACGSVEPNKFEFLPAHALYTSTSELFFKPTDGKQSYSMTSEPFVWKELIDNPAAHRTVHCKYKDAGGQPFYVNIAGDVERIFFEETNKKTMPSSLYKIHLYPTVVLRNLLMYPISYSLQGVNKDFKLSEGESNELWTAEIGKTGLEIRLLNYLDRNWVCYKTLRSDVDELSVWVFETQIGDRKSFLELGMHTQNRYGSLVMQLYAPFVMINKTGLLLTYRCDEDNTITHPPDLEMPVLFSFKAKSFFAKKKASLKIHDSDWSEKFSLDAVGSSGTVVAKTKDGKTYGIGVQIKLSQAGLTKIIVFTPYYLVVNNCQYDIECQELAESADWIKIPTDECIPFWPKNAAKGEMIARYCHDNRKESPVFSFKDHHSTLLGLDSARGGLYVDCQVSESSAILTFEDYRQGHAAALIVNHMESYSVAFHQSGCKKETELAPGCCVLYTWENPMEKRLLMWRCGIEKNGTHDLIKDGIGDFIPAHDTTAYWALFLDGMQRVLMFTSDLAIATAAQEAGELERIEQEITLTLQGVGISLVDNDAKLEIMYMGITSSGVIWESKKMKSSRFKPLSVKDCTTLEEGYQRFDKESKLKKAKSKYLLDGKMEVSFTEMVMSKPLVRKLRRSFQTGLWVQYKTSPHQVQLHAKVNRLQIDNQLLDCVFPVVLAPVPLPKSVVAENAPKPFTELSIMLRKAEHSSVQQFKYCKMLIQEFHVKLDQGFINSIISFFTPSEPAELDYVKSLTVDKETVVAKLKDVASVYSSQEQKSYFDMLHFSPLKVHISFSMTGGAGGQKEGNKPTAIHSDFLNLLLQSVGVTLTEIQDVIFKLDYFERKYVFMSQKQLISEATSHYIGQAVKQLYMLVLGLDVIGNPVGLILGLGEGVTDLFYEPFQGAIQGPEEFAEGLALGVKSLFGHAIGGAAGAASRITGTLGKGIAALTLDKDYQMRRRQNINRRPQDIKQGLAQSGRGLVMGVFEGVTGIVTKPIEGAREEGVGGFFKGFGKGVIGVVTRPTAGVIDFASGSFEAVKRVAELSDEVKRLRPPRFIKQDGVIRPYVKHEAEGHKLLQEVEKGKFANTDIYHAHAPVGQDDKTYLVVTNNRLMYVTKGELFGQWNVEWHYRWNELKDVPCITDKGLRIMLKEPHKKKLNIFGGKVAGKIVHIKDKKNIMWIVAKIEETMKKSV